MGIPFGMFDRWPMPSKAEEELRARAYAVQADEDCARSSRASGAQGAESLQSRGLSRPEGPKGSEEAEAERKRRPTPEKPLAAQ